MTCGHSWEPIPRWNARYRCKWCRALAYRKIVSPVTDGPHPRHDMIVPYVCSKCDEPAVFHNHTNGRNACATHQVPS